MITIYGLSSSSEPDNIRYIGKTQNTIEKRLKRHLSNYYLTADTHKNKWIKYELLKGNKILITSLYVINEDEDWENIEICYIEKYKKNGYKLTNGTNGGEGVRLNSDIINKRNTTRITNNFQTKKEEIEKYNITQSQNIWTAKRTCPICSKTITHSSKTFSGIIHLIRKSVNKKCLVCRSTGRKLSKKTRDKISKSKENISQETRDKISKIHKGKIVSEETKGKLRKANTGKKHSKKTKQKMRMARLGKKFKNGK